MGQLAGSSVQQELFDLPRFKPHVTSYTRDVRLPAIPDSEPPAEELRFVFRSGRLSLAFCATVGERWSRGFERLLTPGHLARWYAEASVTSVPVPVTGPDLAEARAVREAVYRTAKALLAGQPPVAGDEEIINRAAAAAPPVPRMDQGAVVLAAAMPDPAASALSAVARDAIGLLHHRRPAVARVRQPRVRPAVPGPQPPRPPPLVFQQRLRRQGTRRRLPAAPAAPGRNPLTVTSAELTLSACGTQWGPGRIETY